MYELVEHTGPLGGQIIKRNNADGTVSWIPIDESNSDYQAYLRWLENPEAEHFAPNLPPE
jgi:hypothetical protein